MSQTTFSTERESQTSQSSECSTRHKINANKMLAVRCLAEISIESGFWEPSKITLREKLCFSHFQIGGLFAGGVRMRRWYIISISISTMRKNLFCSSLARNTQKKSDFARIHVLFIFTFGLCFFFMVATGMKIPSVRSSTQRAKTPKLIFCVFFSSGMFFLLFYSTHTEQHWTWSGRVFILSIFRI